MSSTHTNRRPLRYVAAVTLTVLISGLLSVRLISIEATADGAESITYNTLADGHRIIEESIAPPRGLILDRAGRVLAENIATYAVQIRPGDLPLTIRPQVVTTLAQILNIDPVGITMTLDRATGSIWEPVRIASVVDERVIRFIEEEHAALPGVETIFEPRRQYPYGPLISQVVGYVGRIDALELSALSEAGYNELDYIGRAGVEQSYEKELRGESGVRQVEIDVQGRVVRDLGITKTPIAGKSVVLTIDIDAQKRAYQALAWGVKAAGNKEGVVSSMNPQNGEIIAMATLPTYDNNLFASGITAEQYQKYLENQNSPLLNHAVGSHFPPGSTYKLVTYSCALENRVVGINETLASNPYLEVGGEKFYEWNRAGFGRRLTPAEGFSFSSAVVTYQLAQRLKIDRLAACGRAWGFGELTGIDLPNEIAGVVPDQDWARTAINRQLYDGEVLQSALGQGYDLATPLQVLNAFAALANGGTLWRPHVVLELRNPDGTLASTTSPVVNGRVGMRAVTLTEMRHAARLVIANTYMTRNLGEIPLDLAGKTGTAEYGVRDKKGRLPYHNWISGFVAPTSDWSRTDADFAYVVFMHGSNTVGNAAIEVLKQYLQLQYNLKRDYRIPGSMAIGNYYGE
ncbi:MAG: penicillin-binding protein 2 [Chloroflexota bacterium]